MENTYTKRMTKAELMDVIKKKDEQINRQLALLAQIIYKYNITTEDIINMNNKKDAPDINDGKIGDD